MSRNKITTGDVRYWAGVCALLALLFGMAVGLMLDPDFGDPCLYRESPSPDSVGGFCDRQPDAEGCPATNSLDGPG